MVRRGVFSKEFLYLFDVQLFCLNANRGWDRTDTKKETGGLEVVFNNIVGSGGRIPVERMFVYVSINEGFTYFCCLYVGDGEERVALRGNRIEESRIEYLAQEEIGHIKAVVLTLLEIAGPKIADAVDECAMKVDLIIEIAVEDKRGPILGMVILFPMGEAKEEDLCYAYGNHKRAQNATEKAG